MMKKPFKSILIPTTFILLLILALIGLGDTLVPLLFSFMVSYLLFPLVIRLESRGIKRKFAVPSVILALTTVMLVAIILIIPGLVSDARDFIVELPDTSSKFLHKIEVFAESKGYNIDLSKDSIAAFLRANVEGFSGGLLKGLTQGLKTSFQGILSWLIGLLNLFLIPLFIFYLINDYEKISQRISTFVPKSAKKKLDQYLNITNEVLSGYIRGQLVVALFLGFLYSLGLYLVGLRFGILIGILSGLISIIPYAGFVLGFFTAIVIALTNYTGINLVLGVSAVYLFVQFLESFIITPKLVGNRVGLGSLSTMLALIIGGNLFGFVGMLIGIPIAAILKVVLKDLKNEYQKLDFYQSK
jgi:predicted PurR-regulated permease PerM